MNIIKKLWTNWIVRNLFLAVVVVLLILTGVSIGLKKFTQHDVSVKVPDMVGMSLQEAQDLTVADNLVLVVADSVFVNRFRHGAVYEQNPKAGADVKRGRKIYVTMNAVKKKQVDMPNLVGLSFRQAKVELQSRNLVLGKMIYVSDIATNNVLAQMSDGQDIPVGKKVDVGTVVDLKLGLNQNDQYTVVTSFAGLPYHRAISAVQDSYLNVAQVYFDESVKSYSDSLAAFVYRQAPDSSSIRKVKMGRGVKLYFTLDESKLPKPAPEKLDSLNISN